MTETDFYDLAIAYFRKARSQNVVYAEVFFDPQAHTSRGVPFAAVIEGFDRARADAAAELGLRAQLIMCFLRDMPRRFRDGRPSSSPCPYKDKIIGVGLDSDERDNPPLKFKEVFRRARAEGYRLTMHCDVDQADAVGAHLAVPGRYRRGTHRPRRQLPGGPALVARLAVDRDWPDRLPGLQRLGDRQHEGAPS